MRWIAASVFGTSANNALAGDVKSQILLGDYFNSGIENTIPNPELGAQWYTRAAVAGSPEAQLKLADYYASTGGHDIRKLNLYRAAMEQSYPPAMLKWSTLAGQGASRGLKRRHEAASP